MAYSESTHFSDKNSYKILFILSYRLKDINIARFNYFLPFSKKQRTAGTFLTEMQISPVH
jgi:hypothetical protein